MAIRRVNEDISVADQITAEEVAEIAKAGYRSIICNRPNGETPDQPDYAAIEAAAEAAGLEIRWQPVVSGQVTDQNGVEFGTIIADLPKPILAYCRTGTRCIALWSLSQAGKMPVDAIIEAAGEAGYNMAPLAPRIVALAKQGND
jgi:sulfide:quinone oxidoreductase